MPSFSVKLYRRGESACWWACVYLAGEGGKQRRFSTGIPIGEDRHESARRATRVAEDRARELAGAAAATAETKNTLREVAKRMLRQKSADGRRARAVDGIAWYLDRHVLPFLGETRDVASIRRPDLEALKAHLHEKGLAAQTINNALTAARQVLKHACVVEELIDAVPNAANVRRSQEQRGRALRPEQIAALLGSVDKRAVEARHFLTLVANTGLRKSEALALRFSWVNWERRIVTLPAEFNKGGRPRPPVALNDVVIDVLRERLALHGQRQNPDDDRVFRQIKHDEARNSAAERAGLGRVRTHDLRHSLGSLHVEAGATLTEVRDDLGHVTLAMVNHYQHAQLERRIEVAQRVQIAPQAVQGPVQGQDGPRREILRDPAQEERRAGKKT